MATSYIEPSLTLYSSLEELLDPGTRKDSSDIPFEQSRQSTAAFVWKDLFDTKRAFVLGEPGCGKSTLLKQVVLQAPSYGKQGIIIPVNYINSLKIEDFITKSEAPVVSNSNIYDLDYFQSNNFSWANSEEIIVCLDALDEVKGSAFNNVLRESKRFSEAYPSISILISCRTHYVSKEQTKFKQLLDFKAISLNNLNSKQIRQFLEQNVTAENKEKVVDILIEKSYTNKGHSILSIPRYLEVQAQILQDSQKTPEEILKMKRVDFFEESIYKKLEKETKAEGQQNEEIITKRVLEKLALVMEIYQVTQITRDELVTFLDDTSSNVNLIFLNHLSLDKFIDRVLKHFGDIIEFDNTEFQEYLAAKELLRIGQKSQILYDLIVESNFKHIYKNWYDVLKYVIEIDASQLMPLVEFLSQKGEYLVADEYFKLIEIVDEDKLSIKEKARVFEVVFGYYQKANIYLWREQAERLSQFYQKENYSFFETAREVKSKEDERYYTNQVLIIENFISTDKVSQEQHHFWTESIKAGAQNTEYSEMQRCCLHALRRLQDIAVYEELQSVFFHGSKDTAEQFVYSCGKVDPNCQFSINIFIEHVKRKGKSSKNAFNYTTAESQLKYLLSQLVTDLDLLEKYTVKDYEFSLDNSYLFLQHISKAWDEELKQNTKKFLQAIIQHSETHFYHSEELVENLIVLINKEIEDFIFELLQIVPDEYRIYNFEKILSKIIRLPQVDKFVNELKNSKYGNYTAQRVFSYIKYSENPEKEQIYEAGRKHFPKVYEQWEKQKSAEETAKEKEDKVYDKFKAELNIAPGRFNPHVFSTYFDNQEVIYRRASGVEIKRLKLLLENIFKNNDVANYRVTITEQSENTKSYSVNNRFVFSYGFYLKVALSLHMQAKLTKYRRYFVQYLPIAGSEDLEFILDYLGPLTQEDIKDLITICENREDDFLMNSPLSFIKAIRILNQIEFIPFLQQYLEHPKTAYYEKEAALECLGVVCSDFIYLTSLFEKFILEKEERFTEIINRHLITKFKHPAAIKWRFDEVKRRQKPFIRIYNRGIQSYSDWEAELDRPKLLNCVINLMDTAHIPLFQDILSYSFDIRSQKEFIEYSNYLQTNVYNYYLSLKNIGSYKPLKELKDFIIKNKNKLESRSFKGYLRNLEIEYIELLDKPKNIADCVKKYNELKSKRYQPILTSLDLFYAVQDVVNDDIVTFIQKEGFYQPIATLMGKTRAKKGVPHVSEDTIQKTVKIQIENGLLKKGFRPADILREVQLYDDKRLDLLISYGFIGPIMLELKLLHNTEITNIRERAAYKEKIRQYLAGTHAQYGFYLVFKVKNITTHDADFEALQEEYEDIENLNITLINCCPTL